MSTDEAHEEPTQGTESGQAPAMAGEQRSEPAAVAPPPAPDQVDGYCVKCKQPRTMTGVEMTRTKNGRAMAKGKCPVCGTTMTKFMKG